MLSPLSQNRRRDHTPRIKVILLAGLRATGRTLRIGLPVALGLVLAGWLGWAVHGYATTTPYFRLRTLRVEGLRRVPRAELEVWSGLSQRPHLLTLDVEALRQRIADHPWVADARVERELPGELRVHVVERRAAALLLSERLSLVDENGVVFAPSEGRGDERLPVITGVPRGQGPDADRERHGRVLLALAVIREWRRQGLPDMASLAEVHLDPVLGPVLFTEAAGTRVHLGRREHPRRLARLKEVLRALSQRGQVAEYVLLDQGEDRVAVGLAPTGGGGDPKRRG